MSEDSEIDRKTFFREGPLSLFRAFMEGARPEETRVSRSTLDGPLLRPPGAAPEADFLRLCEGGAECARACPAEAILMLPREDESGLRAPRIIPADAACVVCDDLACMKTCPTGALSFVAREEIRVGLAQVNPDACFAWNGLDEECDYCAARCPIGESAIRIEAREEGRGPVIGAACVGCGSCEQHCPEYPGAVRVFPIPS